MNASTRILTAALVLAASSIAAPAMAQARGDWAVGVGMTDVNPKDNNGKVVDNSLEVHASHNTKPSATLEYFVADNLGVELLVAAPFRHDIALSGLGTVASTRELPPVLSLQYHFNSAGRVSPFVGVGVNYTKFFHTKTNDGALAGSKLSLDDSWGAAARVGVDFNITPRVAFRADVRWADIGSDVHLNSEKIGETDIDPIVYSVGYVLKF